MYPENYDQIPENFEPEVPVQEQPAYTEPVYQPVQEPTYSAPFIPAPEAPAPEMPKKKRGGKFLGLVALGLCCSLLGGIVGGVIYGSFFAKDQVARKPGSSVIYEGDRQPTIITPATVDTNRLLTAAEVYTSFVNSTVGITTSITTNYWGFQSASAASGSGFILSEDGYVITNHHVIDESDSITVSMNDGSEYDAQLVGYDESNDIAVLKIEAENLTPVVLGKSGDMHVGDDVVAIGNPLGELTFTLTAGKVSALNRDVTMSNGTTMTLIQTDCAINSGNSGGALFNMYGEVIGITNAKYSSSSFGEASIDNIGFAIPIDDVRSIIESIVEKGYISKPYIGVSVRDVSEESQSFGLPKGAAVEQIVDGSPAADSGLKLRDIITHVNGQEISGSSDLVAIVRESEVDDKLVLTVYRMGQTLEITITVGEQVQSANAQEQTQQSSGNEGFSPFPFWGY